MFINKSFGVKALIFFLLTVIFLYNPIKTKEIEITEINNQIINKLPLKENIPSIGLKGTLNDFEIIKADEGVVYFEFDGSGSLSSGTEFSVLGLAESDFYYDDGFLKLNNPLINKIHDYEYELKGKEKLIKTSYQTSQKKFNDLTGKHISLREGVVDKAKEELTNSLENFKIYNLKNKNYFLDKASSNVFIKSRIENDIKKIYIEIQLMPFTLLNKSILVLFIFLLCFFLFIHSKKRNS